MSEKRESKYVRFARVAYAAVHATPVGGVFGLISGYERKSINSAAEPKLLKSWDIGIIACYHLPKRY
jgi:hypothetical protein